MKYISKYFQDKEITPAQFITEMICERKAKKDGDDLHHRFGYLVIGINTSGIKYLLQTSYVSSFLQGR